VLCLVAGCGIHTRRGLLCGACRVEVPDEMLLRAALAPWLWLDVARYVEALRAERASMRRAAS
jgi:hypothetical protein